MTTTYAGGVERHANLRGIGIVLDPFVLEHVQRADEVAHQLLEVSSDVARSYEAERSCYVALQRGQESFEAEVNGALADLDFMATATKEGPLAGIARTSDAYKLVLRKERAALVSGPLRKQQQGLVVLENNYQEAHLSYEAAKVQFQALRTIADLLASVLGVLR